MPPPDPQPTRWTREIATAPRSESACPAGSIRLTTGAAIGFTAGAVASLIAAGAGGRPELIFVAIILVSAAGAFWYITSRDRGRRDRALARERDLVKVLTGIETRLGAGVGTEARRSALADLAEWISLRSRLNGGIFDLDSWRRFTHQHGTPMVVMLGIPPLAAEQLAPSLEEIDLESEQSAPRRRRLLRAWLPALWLMFVVGSDFSYLYKLPMLLLFVGLIAYECGLRPIALKSFVISPGRAEESAFGRARVAEAGRGLAVLEKRRGATRFHETTFLLTILGDGRPLSLDLRHEDDARIPLFLASWLTTRATQCAVDQDAPAPSQHGSQVSAIATGRPA